MHRFIITLIGLLFSGITQTAALPTGTTLVSLPCTRTATAAFGAGASKITSAWHISRTSRIFTHYSGNSTPTATSYNAIQSLKAYDGYYVSANQEWTYAMDSGCSTEAFPALEYRYGWQLRALTQTTISTSAFVAQHASLGHIHAIMTVEGNRWLGFIHSPNQLSTQFYNSLTSVSPLVELTPNRAYWIAMGPSNTFDIISRSGASRLNRPQIAIGDKPGYISKIVGSTAYISPVTDFNLADWPDALKIQLSQLSQLQSYNGNFSFDLRNQANPNEHYAYANTPSFEIRTETAGNMGAYIPLNASISAGYRTIAGNSASITNAPNSSGGYGDATDGASSNSPQRLDFAIQPYITKAGGTADFFKGVSLKATFDLPQLNFSRFQQPVVTNFVVENMIIQAP